MPEYDFKCLACQSDFSLTYKSLAAYSQVKNHACPQCRQFETKRIIGRVAIAQSHASRLDRLADDASLANIDENDPKAVNGFMQKLSKELDSSGENISQTANQMQAKKES